MRNVIYGYEHVYAPERQKKTFLKIKLTELNLLSITFYFKIDMMVNDGVTRSNSDRLRIILFTNLSMINWIDKLHFLARSHLEIFA